MAISLTRPAAERIQSFLAKEPGSYLRLGVRKTGCSGWAYTIDITDSVTADDRQFDVDGVTVVIDEQAFALIKGTELDFVQDGLNRTFTFRNPNVTGECGCGESFAVNPAA